MKKLIMLGLVVLLLCGCTTDIEITEVKEEWAGKLKHGDYWYKFKEDWIIKETDKSIWVKGSTRDDIIFYDNQFGFDYVGNYWFNMEVYTENVIFYDKGGN